MSNIFHVRNDPQAGARNASRLAAGYGKREVIAAAMLTGGASGGWDMARALKSQAARALAGRSRTACPRAQPCDKGKVESR